MKLARCCLYAALSAGFLAVSGCGFKPIYAAPADGAAPLNQLVQLGEVNAPESIHVLVVDALNERIILKEGQHPEYELRVTAKETAERLAVQIDATVTRYNYRLTGSYVLTHLASGARLAGSATAVTSYNIVSSQYSTLFAERTAQEKAARLLAEEIERDLLIRFAEVGEDGPAGASDIGGDAELDGETEIIQEPTRDGDVIRIRQQGE